MKAYEAISVVVSALEGDELVISANGMISRGLHSIMDRPENFYMLGSMGLASSIGIGLALSLPKRKIVILDGDGNLLMNMGSLATVVRMYPENLIHIVLDNECYASTGGQPSASTVVGLERVAASCGFKLCRKIEDEEHLEATIRELLAADGPAFVLVKVEQSWKQVPRVAHSPESIMARFKRFVELSAK